MDGADAAVITDVQKQNNTVEHQAKRPPSTHNHQPHAVKGEQTVQQFQRWLHPGDAERKHSKFSCHVVVVSTGQEGDTCLRSTDCSESLCCARHFWSRICKPVLTEGQVCTRHRRKGNHGLELFQRCDCGEGLVCRQEKGERDHSVSRTAARNLHTCQRR